MAESSCSSHLPLPSFKLVSVMRKIPAVQTMNLAQSYMLQKVVCCVIFLLSELLTAQVICCEYYLLRMLFAVGVAAHKLKSI